MTQIPEGKTQADKDLVHAKRQLEKLMIQFNEQLQDKILQENKTQNQLSMEGNLVLRLLMAANDLDEVNPPEGTFGLISLLIREGLLMRDNNNRMEYKIKLLRQDIDKLKTQIADLSRAGQRTT